MKKVLSVMAVSAFVLTAGVALAGGGKKMGPGCPEACQQQIDDLNSSQAQQNEQLSAHSKQLKNHEGRITALEKAFDDYWYARLGVRAAWMSQDVIGVANVNHMEGWDTDTGFGGAIAFGREFAMYNAPGRFRAELELAYQNADLDDVNHPAIGFINGRDPFTVSGDVSVTTVMLNGYYELPVYEALSIYFMAGLGVAQYQLEIDINGQSAFGAINAIAPGLTNLDDSDTVFAYKAGLGLTYNFTNEIAGDLGYEYLGVADTDMADAISGHNVVASVRFKF